MTIDVTSLIRRDHDELDRILARMVDPATPAIECAALVEMLHIGFTAHAAAQGTVLRRLLGNLAAPPASLRVAVAHLFDDHREQARAIALLAELRPGGRAWIACALELRELLADHVAREELVRASLGDLAGDAGRALAPGYATERLRRLGLLAASRDRARSAGWVFN